jgi:hypothetical protein
VRSRLTLLAGAIIAALLGTTASAAAAAGPAAGTTSGSSDGAASGTLTGIVRVIAVDPSSAVLPAHRPATGRSTAAGLSAAPGSSGAAGSAGMQTQVLVDIGGRVLDVPAGEGTGLRSGDRVTVATVRDGGDERVTAVTAVSRARASATLTPMTGAHRLTLLPVYWSRPDDATRASLTTLATATAAYWSEQSAGKIVITPTVRDWAKITDPGSCNTTAITNAALAADQVTMPTSRFDHVVIYFPARSDCSWAGLGQIGGSLIWDNGLQLTDVTAHEFGHNLGLGHANTANCISNGQRVTLSSSCQISEYRDYADVMGIAMYQPSGNLNSSLADWLGLETVVTAPGGTRTTVDVAPLAPAKGTRAVRVRTTGGWVYADYRPAAGRDVRMPAWGGVQLHYLADGTYPQSQLLDGQPTTSAAFSGTSLPVGRPWTVPGADLTLTVTSITPTGARIDVAPVTAGAAVPVPVLTAPASGTAVGASTTIGWRVTSGVSALRLFVDGQMRSQTTVTGLTGTLQLTGLTSGQHRVTAQALDSTGKVGTASATLSLMVDVAAPTVPSGLALSSSEVLSWRASSDSPAGVAGYVVTLDGGTPVKLGAVTSLQVRTPTSRHVWWVAAVDKVGNVSAAAGLLVNKTANSKAGATSLRVAAGLILTPRIQVLRGTVRDG